MQHMKTSNSLNVVTCAHCSHPVGALEGTCDVKVKPQTSVTIQH